MRIGVMVGPERGRYREKVERLLSRINTDWLPSDVAWDRVGRSWD